MTQRRWITEMGMGADLHGGDYTKAARRAVADALRHSSLSFFGPAGKQAADMHVHVLLGAVRPEAIDADAVATEVPYGTVTVEARSGGLDVPPHTGDDPLVLVNAAILVSFDDGEVGP